MPLIPALGRQRQAGLQVRTPRATQRNPVSKKDNKKNNNNKTSPKLKLVLRLLKYTCNFHKNSCI